MNQIFTVVFLCLVVVAMISDARDFLIPNWVSVAIVVLFIARAGMVATLPIWPHVLVALLVFAVTYGLFLARWFGGGDVKLLSAVSLWAGPVDIVALLAVMGASGAALGCAILWVRRNIGPQGKLQPSKYGLLGRWVARGACPYGIPIGLGALAVSLGRLT